MTHHITPILRACLLLSILCITKASHAQNLCDTLTLRTDSLKIRTVNEAMGVDKSDSLSRPLLLNSPTASSPSRVKRMAHQVKRTGNIFYRFIKNFDDYDTTYISPNYYNFTTMLQNTSYYQIHRLSANNAEGHSQSLSMKPAPSFKIGPYFGWRWIFLGYTFDVSHPRSLGKSSELSLSLYSSMLGCDFVYVRNTGDYRLRKAKGFEGVDPMSVKDKPFTGMNAKTLSFSGYYVFNHRHFSYPAAYNQSTVQRKSCGSAMLGAGFSKQAIQFDYTKLPPELVGTPEKPNLIDEFKFSSVDYNYYYLSGGYAYNWVFAYNWLLGASVMPSVGIRKAKGDKLQGNEIFLDLKNFSFDCTSRLGIVWNNTHWFAGASWISHLYMYRKKRLSVTNSVNYVNIYAGFFFNRKKQYRK